MEVRGEDSQKKSTARWSTSPEFSKEITPSQHINVSLPWTTFAPGHSQTIVCKIKHCIFFQRLLGWSDPIPVSTKLCVHGSLLFTSWLHLGSFSSCAESQIAESQGPWGPGQPHPCRWDSPLCNSGPVMLGIVPQKDIGVRSDENHFQVLACPPRIPVSPWEDSTLYV
jgi:hypothetical protein